MNFLPESIENLIVDYKNQMEHKDKFSASLEKINNLPYYFEEGDDDSQICYPDRTVTNYVFYDSYAKCNVVCICSHEQRYRWDCEITYSLRDLEGKVEISTSSIS